MNDPKPKAEPGNWLEQARALLDAQVEGQDYALRARLTAVRQHVLTQKTRLFAQSRRGLRITAMAAGISALILVTQSVWRTAPVLELPSESVEQASLLMADEDLLAAHDSLDLYENLEFYAWLQSQPVDG